jgi:hypothetical protein
MGMKTAISIPDPVFQSAEQLAARLGVSRSELYCRALRDLLARHDQATVTEQLDAVYGDPENNTGLDPELAAMQYRTLKRHAGR